MNRNIIIISSDTGGVLIDSRSRGHNRGRIHGTRQGWKRRIATRLLSHYRAINNSSIISSLCPFICNHLVPIQPVITVQIISLIVPFLVHFQVFLIILNNQVVPTVSNWSSFTLLSLVVARMAKHWYRVPLMISMKRPTKFASNPTTKSIQSSWF